jgi:hypothetical protein
MYLSLILVFNSLTGSIPPHLFGGDLLESVNMMSNCMSGSLPQEICNSKFLSTLILDLVSSGKQCKRKNNIFSEFAEDFNGYQSLTSLSGSIPSCIWDMTHLNILHVAGNQLSGTIGELNSNNQLQQINLGNNELTGTIPLTWQNMSSFLTLDLSNNNFSGTLSRDLVLPTINSYDSFSSRINRLSGLIPYSLKTVPDDILTQTSLEGNMFVIRN